MPDNSTLTGAPNRWPKGKSGNPRGRPKSPDCVASELRRLLNQRKDGKTRREKVAEALIAQCEAGNPAALRLAMAYESGVPVERMEISSPWQSESGKQLLAFVASVLVGHPRALSALLAKLHVDPLADEVPDAT